MRFKLRIPGRLKEEAPPVANPANLLIRHSPVAANHSPVKRRISGVANLASRENRDRDPDQNNSMGTNGERSASPIGAEKALQRDVVGLEVLPARTDAEKAAFDKRMARSIWLGYADAEGRAVRMLRRDRSGDHRRLCLECTHAKPGWRCMAGEAFLADQLQTCPLFEEYSHD